ncbi:TetR/AcrR family transcriptional regulator [Actinoplanes sp. NPDC049598]|uniref:TetR/AcrR family transcriptional regulator n=1 Tax=Actinoplanes sp. NPDC049598 TaxID=3154626 RepID=UPI00343F4337
MSGYFGSKDGLFDAVVAERTGHLLDTVAFDASDLAGWAVAMYDETLRNPSLVRLVAWLRLERRPAGRLTDHPHDEPKLTAIARAQAAGQVRTGDPLDLFSLVLAMAFTWSAAGIVYAAGPDDPAVEQQRRRALLHESVARAVAP